MSIALSPGMMAALDEYEARGYGNMDKFPIHDPHSRATVYEFCIFTRAETTRAADTARIDAYTKIEGGGTTIGEYVHIASYNHLNIGGGILLLEDGSSLASGVKLITGSNIPGEGRSCSAIAPGNVIKRSFIWIKKNAVVFAGAIVLPGITIGEGSCVAAGSVVREDVPDYEVWAGVPAKCVKRRASAPVDPVPNHDDGSEVTTFADQARRQRVYVNHKTGRTTTVYEDDPEIHDSTAVVKRYLESLDGWGRE